MTDNLELKICDVSALYEIRTMWEKLNDIHARSSKHFAEYYSGRLFPDRANELLDKGLKLRVAIVTLNGQHCGYCISSVDDDGIAEIDSLFVESVFRKNGAGRLLMEDALVWFESLNAVKVILSVYAGNESVGMFYRRFGFEQKYAVYEKIKKEGNQ
jgi:GNAT superfamily N-acetyltransferase